MPTNIEFKAKCNDLTSAEEKLKTLHPTFIGTDYQKDTYYNITNGRLKLREGNIENALIYYTRANTPNAKQSNVLLYQHTPSDDLKQMLQTLHGIKVVVEKQRKIYFVNNVKIHFDEVPNLGCFIEVEAIDKNETISIETLQQQCDDFVIFFGIKPEDFESKSYSDLLLDK
ncbi:MAG: class IV adenylate cyclase [Chitinophagaceae bacterium]